MCIALRLLSHSALCVFAFHLAADAPLITQPPTPRTVFLGDEVGFYVTATGTVPLYYQWYRDGAIVPAATNSTYAFVTQANDDQALFHVEVRNVEGALNSVPVALTIDFGIPGPTQTNRLIEITHPWRFRVDPVAPDPNWNMPGFQDSDWPTGGGLLYMEESTLPAPKTTLLPVASGNLPITCYFRTAFDHIPTDSFDAWLVVHTVVDDGVVLHLNGAEILRSGMPSGAIHHDTLASVTVGNAAWEGPLQLPANPLVPGANLLAAEVHQSTTGSTDIVMGLTLDFVWQPRMRDDRAPRIAVIEPPAGNRLPTLSQIEIQFDEPVWGVDADDLLVNGIPATEVIAHSPHQYRFQFPAPPPGAVQISWDVAHGITDRSANSNAYSAELFGYSIGAISTATQLPLASVSQSADAAPNTGPGFAVDGQSSTFSLTPDAPGSYWKAELGRAYPLERIEIVNRTAPFDEELSGLTLRLFNLDDQVVYETVLSNPGPLGLAVIEFPTAMLARTLWIGLVDTDTNGAGNQQVGLVEVRVYGEAAIPFGPSPFSLPENALVIWQSSEYGGYPASNATDGNPDTFTHTANEVNSYWMADLGQPYPIDRVEIVNRNSCCDRRLAGLILGIFDGASNLVASSILTNPGLGGTWIFAPPPNTQGRWIRVGLEDSQPNSDGNYYVTLAEARVFSGGTNLLQPNHLFPAPSTNNLAARKLSYMVRLDESVPQAANANDEDMTTETKTTVRTVDGYWEVDLGSTHALYGLRAVAASGIGHRLTNTVVRLFDDAHDSVYARKITGAPDVFDVDFDGPRFARFVRVGLEDKQRTDPSGGIEFYIGFREVEVFGRPAHEIGVLEFTASTNQLAVGESVTLSWTVADVQRVTLHPGIGSVGPYTASDGSGSLTLPVHESTEFILVATQNDRTFSHAVSVQVGNSLSTVRISELVADNAFSLEDGYGEAADWLELRQSGTSPVNLVGWGLSDDWSRPFKWRFPDLILAPHESLIVFASGRQETFDPAGTIHTSFRLAREGGTLLLTPPEAVAPVDALVYPPLNTDLAFGRTLDGLTAFLEPTPGAINAASVHLGWLEEIGWSHPPGFYEAGFTLTLSNPNPDSALLYSTDGSEPALLYTNPIPIHGTTVIRAQTTRPGFKSAPIQTRSFLFIDDVITSPVMNPAITEDPAYAQRMRPALLALPSVSICLPGQPEYEEKPGSLEILWPNGGDPVQVNCGISRFGNAWTQYAKRSIRMKCRAKYGATKLDAPLFQGFDRGLLSKASFDKLDFRSGSQDMNERGFYMAGRFVEDTMLDMGNLNPHGRFVHLYLNGIYWGQYDCREFMDEHFLADYLGGSSDDYVAVRGNDNVTDDFVLGTPDPPNLEPWEQARWLKNSFTAVSAYVDLQHLIDFMLLWNYGHCESEFRSAGPIQPGTGFKFWIADADGFLRTSALGLDRTSRAGPGGIFGAQVSRNHPDFKMLLADRIYRHFFNGGALSRAANEARLAARMDEIRDSLIAECARWGYRTPANWESAAANIRSTLFPTRTSQLFGYLRSAGLYPAFDPPTFNGYGGLVTNGFVPTLISSAGTIYYTLDGSDPRLPGGEASPQASVWVPGAVTITSDLTLTARVRSATGVWSALAQPSYLLANRQPPGPRDLWITEIHYNPAGSDDFEFIELWNASPHVLDLSGVALSNAVHFIFPHGSSLAPGAFILVVENAPAFASRYQTSTSPYFHPNIQVAGQWIGALNNAGEILSLVAGNGTLLYSIPFAPSGDWPARPDGFGSSLQFLPSPPPPATDETMRNLFASGINWTASTRYHGSPGTTDTPTPTVRIHEVLTHSALMEDWVELFNHGTEPVDLSTCSVTDDFDQPARYLFPENTLIAPGEFLVLSASQLGFGFSKKGSDIALLELHNGFVENILDSVQVPAAAQDESLGVFMRSDGQRQFTELRESSPGNTNALPRVGPIVISEFMFHPSPDKAAFLELANISDDSVPLFDPEHPDNVWKIDGIGAFAFPPNTVLTPCSTLIVTSTDPDSFRAQYQLSPLVPVFGPWAGRLDDDGETLTLLRPGTPEPDATVPYYRVDQVSYRTYAPWPAITAGHSIGRRPVQAFGNDPGSWRPVEGGTPGLTASNNPPQIMLDRPPTVARGSTLLLTLSPVDDDIPWQTVVIDALLLPTGSSFDPDRNQFTWVPAADQEPGDYWARFSATDDAGCASIQSTLDLRITLTLAPALTAVIVAGQLELQFPVTAGQIYYLEFCTDLSQPNWQLLRELNALETGTITTLDPTTDSDGARFYRVRWEP